MAECSITRCMQQRRFIRKQLRKWTTNMVHIVGLERLAEELMGRKKWQIYQDSMANNQEICNNNLPNLSDKFNNNNNDSIDTGQNQEENTVNENPGNDGDVKQERDQDQQQDRDLDHSRELMDWSPNRQCHFCADGNVDHEHNNGVILSPRDSDCESSDSDLDLAPSLLNPSSLYDSKSLSNFFAKHLNSENLSSMANSLAAVSTINNSTSLFPNSWFFQQAAANQNYPFGNSAMLTIAPETNISNCGLSGSDSSRAPVEQPLDLSAKIPQGTDGSQSPDHFQQSQQQQQPIVSNSILSHHQLQPKIDKTHISNPASRLNPINFENRHIFKAKPRMSSIAGRRTYTEDELQAALRDIQSGKLGTRRAAVIYGIPRSTLRNKVYKLAMEREKESLALSLSASASSTASASALLLGNNPAAILLSSAAAAAAAAASADEPMDKEATLKLVDNENDNDDDDLDDNDEKDLSGAEDEKEVEKALQQPLITIADILRFSNLSSEDSLRNLLQKYTQNDNANDTTNVNPSSSSAIKTNLSSSAMAFENNPLAPFLQNLLLSGRLQNQKHPNQQQQHKQQSSNQQLITDHHLLTNDDYQAQSSRSPTPQSSVIVKNEQVISSVNKEDESSVPNPNVILKIPFYRPSSTSTSASLSSAGSVSATVSATLTSSSTAPVSTAITSSVTSVPFLSSKSCSQNAPRSKTPSDSTTIGSAACSDINASSFHRNEQDIETPAILARNSVNNTVAKSVSLRDVIARSINQNYSSSLQQSAVAAAAVAAESLEFKRQFSAPPLAILNNHNHVDRNAAGYFLKSSHHHSSGNSSSGGGNGCNSNSNNSQSGKGTRPKRGKYRNYDRDSLVEAVRAVQRGEMSVHRAGSYYGVPHSTLEYKVKERHLMRPRKRDPKPAPLDEKPLMSGSSGGSVSNNTAAAAAAAHAAAIASSKHIPGNDLKSNNCNTNNSHGGNSVGCVSTANKSNLNPNLLANKPAIAQISSPNNGLKIFDSSSAAAAAAAAAVSFNYTTPQFPFWHPSFHAMQTMDYNRSSNSSSSAIASASQQSHSHHHIHPHSHSDQFFNAQMLQKLQQQQLLQQEKSGSEHLSLKETSILDGIIRSSFETDKRLQVQKEQQKYQSIQTKSLNLMQTPSQDSIQNPNFSDDTETNCAENKVLLEQLCRTTKKRSTPSLSSSSRTPTPTALPPFAMNNFHAEMNSSSNDSFQSNGRMDIESKVSGNTSGHSLSLMAMVSNNNNNTVAVKQEPDQNLSESEDDDVNDADDDDDGDDDDDDGDDESDDDVNEEDNGEGNGRDTDRIRETSFTKQNSSETGKGKATISETANPKNLSGNGIKIESVNDELASSFKKDNNAIFMDKNGLFETAKVCASESSFDLVQD